LQRIVIGLERGNEVLLRDHGQATVAFSN